MPTMAGRIVLFGATGYTGEMTARALVARGEIDASEVDPDDARQLRETVPEILDVVRRLLAKVHAGELAIPPEGYRADEPALARAGWL